MRHTGNVDTSNLPKFANREEAKAYFCRYGKLTFFGWDGTNYSDRYAVYNFAKNNGAEYFVDIYEDGHVVVNSKHGY